jgi:S1-C subfamily serine protease
MKNKILLILFLIVSAVSVFSQSFKPSYQSNNSLDFTKYLSGVKYAYVMVNDDFAKSVSNGDNSSGSEVILGVISYLNAIGFDNVKWGKEANTPKDFTSLCDLVRVSISWDPDYEHNAFTNIRLIFISCNEDEFEFLSEKNIVITNYTDIKTEFHNKCMKMYGYKKDNSPHQRLKLDSEMTEWTEQKLKSHFLSNGADPIEGIYENSVQSLEMAKYKVGIVKIDNDYTVVYLSGANNYLDWEEGEVKAKLTETATPRLYKANWKMLNKEENSNFYISFETGLMNLVFQGIEKSVYIKLFPTSSTSKMPKDIANSGTGFALTSNGYIVTNYHVIEGASNIKVKGINGSFSTSYNAKVIVTDKNNDLAIIKIEDNLHYNNFKIPYTIKSIPTAVGENVFVLGYPLRASMGDEIKLTNGIISSKTGFQGDITSYQISAPIQPGNSGGPLFDKFGNLIGVINAKHIGAENVSYAIKVSYLKNLIDLLPTEPTLNNINVLKNLSLSDQVKQLNKFVYIIEVK